MRTALAAVAFMLSSALSIGAFALQQPNGSTIPSQMGCAGGQPTGLLPVFACACTQAGVCNIGAPCPSQTSCDDGQHGTCESTMWHSFNDNTCIPTNHSGIDPWNDGAIVPETFHPTCALTYTVQSRGTAMFKNAFGWYNAGTKVPDPSDLHVMLDCNAAAGASVVLDLTQQPAWKGGDVGFFLVTPEDAAAGGKCAGGDCCATVARFQAGAGHVYYSQREFNPDGQGATPFIHLLIYGSQIAPQKYYFGWEDTYQTTSSDFTDLVTSVSGVECSGAGQQCPTGKPGVCAFGVTECSGSQISCQQVLQPSPDVCNGVDDDCNGQVDDGATCAEPGDVCVNGKCVQPCGSQEFQCPQQGTQCDPATGLCVDPTCVGVKCGAGLICQAGQCGTPCNGVVCPHGLTCVGDACVDLCSGVACLSGDVCSDGVCLPGCGHCGGVACASPLACDSTGACTDPSCAGGCPNGKWCSGGQCVDACQNAKCPGGQSCQGGQCVGPGASTADGGLVAVSGTPGGVGGVDGGGSGNEAPNFNTGSGGCGCRSAPGDEDVTLLVGGVVAVALLGRRRRVCLRGAAGRH